MAQESRKMDKDETGCQPLEGPLLCVNNCGFFGSAATMNLCSKCYRELVLKQTKAVKVAASASVAQSEQPVDISEKQPPQQEIGSSLLGPSFSRPSGNSTVSANIADENDPSQQHPKQSPNRCFTCRKRVGLTGFKCRCGDTFCAVHRYSDKHDCAFDYKTVAREAIAKANPVVKAEKIDKI